MVAPGITGFRCLLQDELSPILLAQVIADSKSRLPTTND
jgi:hypothetical protein